MSTTSNSSVMIKHEIEFEVIKHFQNRSKRWAAYTTRETLEQFKRRHPGSTTLELEKPHGCEFGSMIYKATLSHEDRDAVIELRKLLEADLKRHVHKDVVYKLVYRKVQQYNVMSEESISMTGRSFHQNMAGCDGT